MDVEALARYWRNRPGKVTGALQALQKEAGYLEENAMNRLAEALEVPLTQLYGVATFFSAFRLEPRGRRHIQVCQGTACHVRGGARIMEKLQRDLGVAPGEVTGDGRFSLEAVRCLGCCGLAPVAVVNDSLHGRLNQARMGRLFRSIEDQDEGTI